MAVSAAGRVRMEAWRQWRGRQPAETHPDRASNRAARERIGEERPHTPRGGKPPETPDPLSLWADDAERGQSVKGPQAAPKGRALDRLTPF
jgi:hypothetical protein